METFEYVHFAAARLCLLCLRLSNQARLRRFITTERPEKATVQVWDDDEGSKVGKSVCGAPAYPRVRKAITALPQFVPQPDTLGSFQLEFK